jgi:hypothetical protein
MGAAFLIEAGGPVRCRGRRPHHGEGQQFTIHAPGPYNLDGDNDG